MKTFSFRVINEIIFLAWPLLKDVPSALEGSRMVNLKKDVLNWSYGGNCGVALGYFGKPKRMINGTAGFLHSKTLLSKLFSEFLSDSSGGFDSGLDWIVVRVIGYTCFFPKL